MKLAILRGINVGGKRKILMHDLKYLFEKSGFKKVKTYIQSGNILFIPDSELTEMEIAENIEQAILDHYGFEVPVIVRSVKDLEQVVLSNPFYHEGKVDINQLHLTFLKSEPDKDHCIMAESNNVGPDRFLISGKDVFLFCNGKYSQSKLTNSFFESRLKVAATTRNWKTVLNLLALSKELN